ncbi:hypothetical protein ABPG74_017503 [Tetrahymena malaccensis]
MNNLDPRAQSYCGTVISWSISPTTLNVHYTYDYLALMKYQGVYGRWLASGGSNNKDPTNDCLGIMRSLVCAYHYPVCDPNNGDRFAVCGWYCEYLKDRCPKETDLINEICSEPQSSWCAYSNRNGFKLFVFFVILFVFII